MYILYPHITFQTLTLEWRKKMSGKTYNKFPQLNISNEFFKTYMALISIAENHQSQTTKFEFRHFLKIIFVPY